jgi:hypothetical protein
MLYKSATQRCCPLLYKLANPKNVEQGTRNFQQGIRDTVQCSGSVLILLLQQAQDVISFFAQNDNKIR